jgi:hypothetical protein
LEVPFESTMKDTQLLSSGYQEDQCFHHPL